MKRIYASLAILLLLAGACSLLTGGGSNGDKTQVSAPAFSPPAGSYTAAQAVAISTSTQGAAIRYTTDGSSPTSSTGTVYSSPVSVAASQTLKAIAYESGMIDSAVSTAAYTISIAKAYVVGASATSSNSILGSYWIDGARTDLSGGLNNTSFASGIAVSGSDVYVVGTTSAASISSVPGVWLNGGSRIDLPVLVAGTNGTATDIAISGGHQYVAGYTQDSSSQNVPCYWLDGVRHDLPLPNGSHGGMAWHIAVANNTVYTAGSTTDSTGNLSSPCYWSGDSARVDLSVIDATKSGLAEGIFVAGGAIYVAGYSTNGSSVPVPCYWTNGSRTDLAGGKPPLPYAVMGIAASGTDVYVTGETDDAIPQPCYWLNGTKSVLSVRPVASTGGQALGLALLGGDVYIAGWTGALGVDFYPCYWKNGTRTDLPMAASYIGGIAFKIRVE